MTGTSEDTQPSGTTPGGDDARADLHPVVTEHQIIGTQTGRQGAGQVVPEDLVLCIKCGWMRCSDYTWHLSDALAAGRAETATEEWPRCKASRDGGCARCHDEHGRHVHCRAETTTATVEDAQSWVCGRCGEASESHAAVSSQCVYDPVLVTARTRPTEPTDAQVEAAAQSIQPNYWDDRRIPFVMHGETRSLDELREADRERARAMARDALRAALGA